MQISATASSPVPTIPHLARVPARPTSFTEGRTIQADSIRARDLRSLLDPTDPVLALVIPGFIDPEDAERIKNRLLREEHWSNYGPNGAPAVAKLGDALFGCFAELGEGECRRYFENAAPNRRLIQKLLGPYANPADRVVAEVDRVWPPGCSIMRIGGKVCALGLPRAFRRGGKARAHTDRASWDFPRPETIALQTQFAFNVYLSMTRRGGELVLWDYRPNRQEYEARRDGYAIREDLIPPAQVTIRPAPGDLILFDAARVHRVNPSSGKGARVTFSGFLGYESLNRPLWAFS